MTVSASIALQQGGTAGRVQGDVFKALRRRFISKDAQSDNRINHESIDFRHRSDIGSSAPARAAAHFSAERDNNGGHVNTSCVTRKNCHSEASVSAPKVETTVSISTETIRERMNRLMFSKSVKELEEETGFSQAAIRKYRLYGVPDSLVDSFEKFLKGPALSRLYQEMRAVIDQEELDRRIAAQEAEIARLKSLKGRLP